MINAINIIPVHINTVAKIRHEIFGHPHWLEMLKAAVLFRERYTSELADTERQIRALERSKDAASRDIQRLQSQQYLDSLQQAEIEDEIEARLDRIAEIEEEILRVQPAIRDTELLMKTAREAEEQILAIATAKHPDLGSLSYEQIQNRFAPEAFTAQLARLYTAAIMSSPNGTLSPDVAQELLKLPPAEIQNVVQAGEAILRGLGIIPALPAESDHASQQ